MKLYIFILSAFFIYSCGNGAFNETKGEFHYENNISKGQELIDLKEALDRGAIKEEEF